MTSGRKRRAVFLAIAAAVGWMGASFFDLKTEVSIDVLPGKVTWTVAGTTLSIPSDVAAVTAVNITTWSGFFPTGAQSLTTRTSRGEAVFWPIGQRFRPPAKGPPPVGDWWVDAAMPEFEAFAAEIDLGPDFTLVGVFTGRFHQHLTIVLSGAPGIRCSFRRGMLNNDLHILDDDGMVLASGSIDPRLGDRFGAIIATVLRAMSVSALLIAVWTMLPGSRGQPRLQNRQPAPRRHDVIVVMISAAAAAAFSAWTAIDVLEDMPHLPDEVVYRMQSEWILSGSLTGGIPPCPEYFEVPFTYFRGDRWIGHYPPAWPLVLAPGTALGAAWLVPSLLRFGFVVCIGLLGFRVAGRWVGITASLLATTSPLATLLFASTLPHAGSATLLLISVYLVITQKNDEPPLRLALAGVALGAAFAIRPLTALAYALPLGLYLATQFAGGARRLWHLASVAAGGLVVAVPTFVANSALTGSPWRFSYSLADAPMVAADHLMFGIRNVDAILALLLPHLHGWGWPWLPYPFVVALPFAFALIPFLGRGFSKEDILLLALVVSVAGANAIARANGLHGYGPRYAFAACGPLWILTGCGVAHLARMERRRLSAAGLVTVVLIASAALALPSRLGMYRGYNDVDRSLLDASAALPSCSMVLLEEDDWRGWASATPWIDPAETDEPVFALDLGDASSLEVCFPNRTFFRWRNNRLEPVGLDDLIYLGPTDSRTSAAASAMAPRP